MELGFVSNIFQIQLFLFSSFADCLPLMLKQSATGRCSVKKMFLAVNRAGRWRCYYLTPPVKLLQLAKITCTSSKYNS